MSQDWYESKIAPTDEALAAGDGCHRDEGNALREYLGGSCDAQQAAEKITAPVLRDPDPIANLYRLWALLCDGMVELSEAESKKTMDLLAALEKLPATKGVDWNDLPGFASMWHDLHRLHLHGPDGWEKEDLSDERRRELREHFRRIGHAEAELCLRGLGGANLAWGYGILNLVSSKRRGLDVFLDEVLAWLEVAGKELKEGAVGSDEMRLFSRPVPGSTKGQQAPETTSLREHWVSWKQALSGLAQDNSEISHEGKTLAARCSQFM